MRFRMFRKDNVMAVVILMAGAAFSIIGFDLARDFERARVENEFNLLARDRAESFEKEVLNNIGVLYSVVSLFDASESVEREEFRKFTEYVFRWQKDILSITWAPRVLDSGRDTFEAAMRSEGFPDFEITETNLEGDIRPSGRRSEYFPNVYVEPFENNRWIFGLDSSSEAKRREAQRRALETGGPAASDWIHLTQGKSREFGCRLYAPFFRSGAAQEPGTENLRGFVSLNFEISRTAEIAWQNLAPRGIVTFIREKSEPDHVIGFYNLKRQPDSWVQENLGRRSELRWTQTFLFLDKEWEVVMMPGEGYLRSLRGIRWRPWGVLAAGFLVSFMAAVYFRELLGRTAKIEKRVRDRTAELSEANKSLAMEIEVRRQTEQALVKANEKLRSLNDLKSGFVANVAHELNNPLGIIREAISLVREDLGASLSPDHREFLEMGERSARRLIRLVDDLLDLSRIEAGKMKLKIEPVDLAGLVTEVIRGYERELAKKNLTLHREISPVGLIQGDHDKLTEVVINLLSNAIKYTPSGSVRIRLSGDEREVHFEITDTGPGIPPEYLDKVFDKFERILTEKQEGTGLGLPIARDIVELHKGRIWVVSEIGKGSTFIFTLPRDCR